MNNTVSSWWQHPVIAYPGYWFVTAIAVIYGIILCLGRVQVRSGMLICAKMPRWSFGRGGTMVGAVLLSNRMPSFRILAHEKVHQLQWKRYGIVFPFLYFRAGLNHFKNRFEIEAGLEDGGYQHWKQH